MFFVLSLDVSLELCDFRLELPRELSAVVQHAILQDGDGGEDERAESERAHPSRISHTRRVFGHRVAVRYRYQDGGDAQADPSGSDSFVHPVAQIGEDDEQHGRDDELHDEESRVSTHEEFKEKIMKEVLEVKSMAAKSE